MRAKCIAKLFSFMWEVCCWANKTSFLRHLAHFSREKTGKTPFICHENWLISTFGSLYTTGFCWKLVLTCNIFSPNCVRPWNQPTVYKYFLDWNTYISSYNLMKDFSPLSLLIDHHTGFTALLIDKNTYWWILLTSHFESLLNN